MQVKKILAVLAIIPFLIEIAKADELSDLKKTYNEYYVSIQNNIQKISALQNENEKLKKTLDELNAKLENFSKNSTSANVPSVPAINSTTDGDKVTNVDKYNKIIEKISSMSGTIFSENNLNSNSAIGLFEFIEPNAFFISIDDLNNPAGVTAFKTKILYNYDSSLNLRVAGIFSLDYKTQYYITKFGKNPFAKSVRIRVKNPTYRGKLLDSTASSTSSNISASTSTVKSTSTSTSVIPSGSAVTIEMVKAAYSKNKIPETIKLSDEYIKKDPNNVDILRIRYRSYYMIGKYNDALSEILKIDAIQGSSLVKVVACDGSAIARLAKNMDLNKKYGDICKSK
ncbi:MAG: hypothetical protein PHS92_03115 [Candidatus Gracilibacteria bacterium]|nr:hypothetical protein [Candidatus Gracilibacteria bacterium]